MRHYCRVFGCMVTSRALATDNIGLGFAFKEVVSCCLEYIPCLKKTAALP